MSYSYDLTSQPWVPCKTLDGQYVELGLHDVLTRAHELQGIQGDTPPVTVSLHRLLIAVLHRIFGPKNLKAWEKLWIAKKWDEKAISAYFASVQDHFDLFHEKHPFYQCDDPRVKPKSIINLVPHFASGNNATLFDHKLESEAVSLSPAEAARFLLAMQAFGLAGLSGLPKENFTDGPLARYSTFLIQGSTVFETLCLNLIRYDMDEGLPFPKTNAKYADSPAWESEDAYKPIRDIPLGYLDYLTWQSRKLLLLPQLDANGEVEVSRIKVAPGLISSAEHDLRDPMQHYRADEKRGWLSYRFREGKSLWRDSSALLSVNHLDAEHAARPPLTFEWAARLVGEGVLDASQTLQIVAMGMASNQAKIDFYKQEIMPLPLEYLGSDELVGALGDELAKAEAVRNKFWGALRRMAELFLAPQADEKDGRKPDPEDMRKLSAHWDMDGQYWAALEIPFYNLVRILPTNQVHAVSSWRDTLRLSARSAFETAEKMVGDSSRGLKASVKARGQLESGLAQVLGTRKKEEIA